MGLFGRSDKVAKPVAGEYYNLEPRDRAGIAWMLGLGTLILTVVLALGLFFGGRWAYRKIRGTDTPAAQTVSDTENKLPETILPESGATPTPAPAPTPATTPAPAPTPTPLPSTGTDVLPRTGDDGM